MPNMTDQAPEARLMAKTTNEVWTTFAHTWVPGAEVLPNWPASTPENRATMVLDNTSAPVDDPQKVDRELWQSVIG